MRIVILYLFSLTFQGCKPNKPSDFILQKNQDWTREFQNNSLPAKTLFNDKVYCSSIRVGLDNYLYCLNLRTGTVDWVTRVKNWATNPPIVNDSLIYYSSYGGDLYRLDLKGNIIWEQKTNGVFREHCINPWNGNLMVTTVTNGLFEYNSKSGGVVKNYAGSSFSISSPVFLENYFLIAGVKRNNEKNLFGDLLVAFDPKREEVFEREIGNVRNLTWHQDRLYYLLEDSSVLISFDLTTKKRIWQSQKIVNIDNNNIFVTDSAVYCYGNGFDRFYEIDIKKGNIKRIISYKDLLEDHKIRHNSFYYRVGSDKKTIIKITDSLETPSPMYSELNIYIN